MKKLLLLPLLALFVLVSSAQAQMEELPTTEQIAAYDLANLAFDNMMEAQSMMLVNQQLANTSGLAAGVARLAAIARGATPVDLFEGGTYSAQGFVSLSDAALHLNDPNSTNDADYWIIWALTDYGSVTSLWAEGEAALDAGDEELAAEKFAESVSWVPFAVISLDRLRQAYEAADMDYITAYFNFDMATVIWDAWQNAI